MKDYIGFLQLLIIIISLSGCNSIPIYLHSNETQTVTKSIKDTASNLNADQKFQDVNKRLLSFANDENYAVAEYLIASRDAQFADLAWNDERDKEGSALINLKEFVDKRFKEIVGEKIEYDKLADFINLPANYRLIDTADEIIKKHYRSALIYFQTHKEKGDSRSTDCPSITKDKKLSEDLDITHGKELDISYARIVHACFELKGVGLRRAYLEDLLKEVISTEKKATEKEKKAADNAKATLISNVSTMYSLEADSLLSQIYKNFDDAKLTIDIQESKSKEIEKLINELEKKAKDASLIQSANGQVSEAYKEIQVEIQEKQTKLKELLKGAEGVVKFVGADRLLQSLQVILTQNLKTDATVSDSKTDQEIKAILKLTDSLKDVADVFHDKPQIERVGAIVIAIIEQRHYKDMASLEIKRQQELLKIYQDQKSALLLELAHLAKIIQKLNLFGNKGDFKQGFAQRNIPHSISLSLSSYAASWNQGKIPYSLLRYKEVQTKRLYNFEMARRTEKNYRDLLAPAYEALNAYGEGGIHPETIATVMTNLGLIAAFAAR